MSRPILFKNEESDEEVDIKTNNEYATSYNQWRKKEELHKLKTKYGDQITDMPDDDSDTSDDDEGTELPQTFEKDFFKTLACLKKKDPKIYDDQVVFFEETSKIDKPQNKSKKIEPLFMKDYERKMILEKGAKFEDSDEEIGEDPRSQSPTYVQEQERLKDSFKKALKDEEPEEGNWGGFLQKREKTREEEDQEEDDYKKWLKGNMEQLDDKNEERQLKPLKEYWNDPKLDKSEAFLRDYLLNKRYLENEDNNHIPTYEEIIHDSDEDLSNDEKAIDEQDEFEIKYNFRFEEPDDEFIKRYPRTMEHSVRKTDDRRKVKRVEIKERKEEEKKQKHEDLKQLKVLKRQEIEEKIQKLKEITGNNEMAFQDIDLDGDFDPDEHDKKMQELFNDQYYQGQEGDLKPEFLEMEDELGPWKGNEPHCEDDDFNMDCDFDPSTSKIDKGKKKRNRPEKTKKKSDLDDIPVDKNDTRYEEYMDELYKLDYEDIIGDTPCRFKYRDVMPNDFGLSVEEILIAKDKELNRWSSLKKATQIRPDHIEKYDVIAYKRKAMNEDLKRRYLPSIFTEEFQDDSEEQDSTMNKNTVKETEKHESTKKVEENLQEEPEEQDSEDTQGNDEENKEIDSNEKVIKKKNKRNVNKNNAASETVEESTETKRKIGKNTTQKRKDSDESLSIEETKKQTTDLPKPDKSKNNVSTEIQKTDLTEVNPVNTNKVQKKKSTKKSKKLKKKQASSNAQSSSKKIKNSESITENTGKLTRRQKKNKLLLAQKAATNALQKESKDVTDKDETKNVKKRKLSEPNKSSPATKKRKFNKQTGGTAISDSRLEAYGINPKKFKNKLKYNNTNNKK